MRNTRKNIFIIAMLLAIICMANGVENNVAAATKGATVSKQSDIRQVKTLSLYAYDEAGDLYPGQTISLDVTITPKSAISGLVFKSSDSSIASVDQYGRVTGHKKGTATITATANNGVKGSCKVTVSHDLPQLQFKKTSDGKGYRITGCEATAYTVNIPATYKKLPVTEIAGDAFVNCTRLTSFTTDRNQKTFYAVDGVLFTDKPQKTLVKFPNYYGGGSSNFDPDIYSYYVPEGTVAIAEYAFAGLTNLNSLYIPEGVTTIGDYAFYMVDCFQVAVTVPDSLVNIGKNLMQGQKSNVPFYANSTGTIAYEYARTNNIPCGIRYDYVPDETDAHIVNPESKNTKKYKKPSDKNVEFINFESEYEASTEYSLMVTTDISEQQKLSKKEVRINYDRKWRRIIEDSNGRKLSSLPAAEGVYGLGYTEEEALLVGYDLDGNATRATKVKGNFIYAFPGAVSLGISGGKSTTVTSVPYEPIFTDRPGKIRLSAKGYSRCDDGAGIEYVIMAFPRASFSTIFPSYNNVCSTMFMNTLGMQENNTKYYSLLAIYYEDPSTIDLGLDEVIVCDGLEKLTDNSDIEVYANASYGMDASFGNAVADLYKTLKQTMEGTYFPKGVDYNKLTILANGKYPTAFGATINLDDYSCDISEVSTVYTLLHEMTHTIDNNIPVMDRYYGSVIPTPWMEGRAEYIGRKALEKLGLSYWSYEDSDFDWSFLSEADKADFYSYYYNATNRETEYSVGYYFFKYLCDTYGEKVSSKIVKNLSKVDISKIYNLSEKEKMLIFKKCVTDATSETVFQDFVNKVVE